MLFFRTRVNPGNVTLYIVHRKLCEMMEKLQLSLAFSLGIVPSANFVLRHWFSQLCLSNDYSFPLPAIIPSKITLSFIDASSYLVQ